MRLLRHFALRPTARIALLALTGTLLTPLSSAHALASAHAQTGATSRASGGALTDSQALAQARETGKPVPVPAQTTATSAVTANPAGTLSLTENAVPVRKLVAGTWRPLDATLTRNPDGTITPKLPNSALRLSGGGTGALATMAAGTHSLSLTLPADLPAPTLSGAIATYSEVASGVDLVVTATTLGGFSDVLVVKNATAAASPALGTLLSEQVSGPGLTVSADGVGNLTAATAKGDTVFTANAPTLWDSATSLAATPALAATAFATAVGADRRSSPAAPGQGAHTGKLAPALSGHRLTLSPDKAVLSGAHTVYPVYIDPSWGPASKTGWATVAEEYPSQSYWNKTAESAGYMAVGYSSDLIAARTLINFPVPTSTLSGATISGATLYGWNTYSGGCPNSGYNQTVDIDAPSTTLTSSNAVWTSWDTSAEIGSTIGYKSFAYGYSAGGIGASSSCTTGGASVGIGLNTATFTNDVSSGKSTQTLALVAENESNIWGWKLFNPTTAQLTIIYDHAPKITSLASNSSTACAATSPGVLGKGSVNLTAGVYDADGGNVTAEFGLYNSTLSTQYNPASTTGATTSTKSPVSATSGTQAILNLPLAFFTGLGVTTTAATFAWTVYDTDGTLPSSTSTCYFTYDPTAPGAPTVTDAAGYTCPSNASTQTYTIGTAASFTLTDTNTLTGVPGSYTYQLNGAGPISATAASSSPYTALITLKPTRGTNLLTVTAVSASGNLGQTQTCTFQANSASSTDKDLTGDGLPDVLTVGTGAGTTASGLWLAQAQNTTGAVSTTPANIGINGNGFTGDNQAADFNTAQAITGAFTGSGLQDVLVYYPTGTNATKGAIYNAPGDGSAIQAQYQSNVHQISGDLLPVDGYYPQQLANAYNSASSTLSYPDLIGINADPATGLVYYPNGDQIAAYGQIHPPIGTYNSTTMAFTPLSNPTGGTDWKNWSIATTQISGKTWMFLWNTSTKALYLWKDFAVTGLTEFNNASTSCTVSGGPDICVANSYTQYAISSAWNPGTLQTLEAADINADHTPDLWAVTTAGTTTPYTVGNLATTPTITAGTAQPLGTATHAWTLNDSNTDAATVSTALDNTTATALPLTGGGGAAWHRGDLFDPDVKLNGTDARLSTASAALGLTGSFTISAWAKPIAYGGAVLAQAGSADIGLTLYAGTSGWVFSLNTGPGTANSYDTITGGTVQLGAWTHLTATYDKSTTVMSLYVDDVFVATGNHTAPTTGATGDLLIGFDGTRYFTGQIAQVQTWNGSALAPIQPYTPPAYHQAVTPTRLLDTRTSNVTYSNNPATTPVAAGATTTLKIVGDSVTPAVSGAPTTIPTSATAAAIDVTVANESSNGSITTYPNGTQRPLTSSTNYGSATTATGYQIVPIGLDGKIALYNGSSGTADLIVDLTGYYTTDATLTGHQTYHPLDPAQRALSTASSTANTNLTATGTVANGTTFTLQITGQTSVPSYATAVAANLTTYGQAGNGYLQAYATGTTVTTDTALSYHTSDVAQMAADIPLGTGGKISITNYGAATNIIIDIAGYFTTDTTAATIGEFYHTANPTRLVDTRSGIGGTTATIPANTAYSLTQATIGHITTTANPILATMLTVTTTTASGNIIAYGKTRPATSNVNWSGSGVTAANLALPPTNTSDGTTTIYLDSLGSANLIIDCSGYFTTS
jgi:hypothetical protein